ncbi:uncharacterized protein F5Z01DRAFT_652069 [Emericellopsis atlantica]|uniref:SET domain-containing protein n=1 Tax=Emericellopsis atlantica TaxID=2614577 RepID=A0A9P8CQY7_9HYPO|nr:uncharacterized protein F5Z01DRAFT_652069 [Emericellopsis atlantica]KAG9255762.1 hypothetical protein F5Z01DRAFT_652069 [Emericellopsis atlantica]
MTPWRVVLWLFGALWQFTVLACLPTHVPMLDLRVCGQNEQASFGPSAPQRNSTRPWTLERRQLPTVLQSSISPFRLYSSSDASSGLGMSVICTHESAVHLERYLSLGSSTTAHQSDIAESDLFRIANIPARGCGLIAKQRLRQGDVLMAQAPILLLDFEIYSQLEERKWIQLHHEAVAALSLEARTMFWQLDAVKRVDPLTDRIRANAFALQMRSGTYLAVFPNISLLNHDCDPNATYDFSEESLTQKITISKPIQPGSEIVISYLEPHLSLEMRQSYLSSMWGFKCSCSTCQAESTGVKE